MAPPSPVALGPRKTPALNLKLSPLALLKLGTTASERVSAEGERLIGAVREAAENNTMGPAAVFCRRIRSRLDNLLPKLRRLEATLGGTGAGRPAVQQQIDTLEQSFYRDARMDVAELDAKLREQNQSGMLDTIKAKLPEYFQEAIRREGMWLPKVPGTFGTTGGFPPTGIEWTVTF